MAYLGSKWRFLGVFPLEEQPKPRELPWLTIYVKIYTCPCHMRGLIECPLSFHRFLAFGVHTPSRSGIVAYLGVFGRICQYATTTAPFSAYSSTLLRPGSSCCGTAPRVGRAVVRWATLAMRPSKRALLGAIASSLGADSKGLRQLVRHWMVCPVSYPETSMSVVINSSCCCCCRPAGAASILHAAASS